MRHGFLLIDKPLGPTSHDVVGMVRRTLSEKKIGHLGTLDPAATGLLVLAVGAKALKVVELFGDLEKQYDADITFGAESTTYDREGTIEVLEPKPGWNMPTQVDIQNEIEDYFLGKIDQVPPSYSAIKIGGERAYRKMRQGRGVDLPARTVEIKECDILSYDYPNLCVHVECGSGTYIRSLAHDLGKKLRCGGYLAGLRRTHVGRWSVENAVQPDSAKWTDVMPLKEVLKGFPSVELTDEQAQHIQHGRKIEVTVKPNTIGWHDELPIAVLRPATDHPQMAHARKVL